MAPSYANQAGLQWAERCGISSDGESCSEMPQQAKLPRTPFKMLGAETDKDLM